VTVSESRGKSSSEGSGTIESEPEYWCELNPSAPRGDFDRWGDLGRPLMLAAIIVLRALSNASAPGYQPTGIRPRSLDSAGLSASKSNTAIAF
jgi:hypothetical protein